jgi:hypothetical protein
MEKIKALFRNSSDKSEIYNFLNNNGNYYFIAFLTLTGLSFFFAHPISGIIGGIFFVLTLGGYLINSVAILSLSLFFVSFLKIKNILPRLILGILVSFILVLIPFTKDIYNVLTHSTRILIYADQKEDFDAGDTYMVNGNIRDLPINDGNINVANFSWFLKSVKSNPFKIDIDYGADEGCGCSYWENDIDGASLKISNEKEFNNEQDFKNYVERKNLYNNKFLVLEANENNNILNIKLKLNDKLLGEYSTYIIHKERVGDGTFGSGQENSWHNFNYRYSWVYLHANIFTYVNSKLFHIVDMRGLDNINSFIEQVLNIKSEGWKQRDEIITTRQSKVVKENLAGIWIPKNDVYGFKKYILNSDGTFSLDGGYKGQWNVIGPTNYKWEDNVFDLVLESQNFGGQYNYTFSINEDYSKISFLKNIKENGLYKMQRFDYVRQ